MNFLEKATHQIQIRKYVCNINIVLFLILEILLKWLVQDRPLTLKTITDNIPPIKSHLLHRAHSPNENMKTLYETAKFLFNFFFYKRKTRFGEDTIIN